MKITVFQIKFHLVTCVPEGPNDKKSPLVQVLAWRWTGKESLPESLLTKIYGATVPQ